MSRGIVTTLVTLMAVVFVSARCAEESLPKSNSKIEPQLPEYEKKPVVTPPSTAKESISREDLTSLIRNCGEYKLRKLVEARTTSIHYLNLDLKGAALAGCDFREFDLTSANLSGADMRGARLEGADLTGARLEGAKLEETSYDDETLFTLLFQPELHGMKRVQEGEEKISLIVDFEKRAGHYNDYRSRVTVRDGHAWVHHKVFDILGDRPGTPVHFDRVLTSHEIAELKKLAASTKLPNKPCPEIKLPKSDNNPCEVRVAIKLDGTRKEARFWCHDKKLTKKTKPLTSAMKELRDTILKENNWVDEGL